jgi:hypothetical protein
MEVLDARKNKITFLLIASTKDDKSLVNAMIRYSEAGIEKRRQLEMEASKLKVRSRELVHKS